MTAVDQLQYLSWLLFLSVFVLVLVRTIGRPTPSHINMTLFFGAIAISIVGSSLTTKLNIRLPARLLDTATIAAVLALGYLLMRLVSDFSRVPTLLVRAVELGMLASFIAALAAPQPLPLGIALPIVLYLGLVIAYDAWAFARQATRSRGVTRRRMQAVAIASVCIVLALLIDGLSLARPDLSPLWDELSAIMGLAAGIGYFVGFAPPTWLRRAWQAPEVTAFLAQAVHSAAHADVREVVRDLEQRAADIFGAAAARVVLWDPDHRSLRVGDKVLPASLAQAWVEQRPRLVNISAANDAECTAALDIDSARAALAAPITAYQKQLGLLLVFSQRSPVFANSDLELIRLLADQTAVILESRALVEEATRVHAREEAARLKEDFLSSAAHDLKTPLTGIVTQAQVLKRRAERDPAAPADRVGLDRLLEQSHRLKNLVLELLDVSRLEQGSLIGDREHVNLTELIQTLARQEAGRWKRVELRTAQPMVAPVDRPRFEQVVVNLIENALKYSSQQAAVRVELWRENGEVLLSVHDDGIGIPVDDQPLVFERFHRARNVDDRRFAGMGLGLYIARGIVEQHGGRIWVESTPGTGSTFYVAVPAGAPEAAASESPAGRL